MFVGSATTDWISAVATCFAAVGTVAAVIVALWQVLRHERPRLKVRAMRKVEFVGGDWHTTGEVQFRGVNVGRRAITVESVVIGDGTRTIPVAPSLVEGEDELPKVLDVGSTVNVTWDSSGIRQPRGKPVIVVCGLRDSFGTDHLTTLPGLNVKRSGWFRRNVEYVEQTSKSGFS